MTNKKAKPGTPQGYRAGMGGKKIRSNGAGRGEQRGKGIGPLGKPVRSK